MPRIPRGRYTKEFREEAVKLLTEEKLSLPEAGRRLNLGPSTLTNWVKAYKDGKPGEVGQTYRPLTEIEMELYRTKRELAEVKIERIVQRVLRLAGQTAFQARPGRNATGSGDQSSR